MSKTVPVVTEGNENQGGFARQLRLSERLQASNEAPVVSVVGRTTREVTVTMEPMKIYEQLKAGQTISPRSLPVLLKYLKDTDTRDGAVMLLNAIALLAAKPTQSTERKFLGQHIDELLALACRRVIHHVQGLSVDQVSGLKTETVLKLVHKDQAQDWGKLIINLASIIQGGPPVILSAGNYLQLLRKLVDSSDGRAFPINKVAQLEIPAPAQWIRDGKV